jgi:hypothetical protein
LYVRAHLFFVTRWDYFACQWPTGYAEVTLSIQETVRCPRIQIAEIIYLT